LADVRGRIADLRRMAEALRDVVRACEAGESSGCPMIETLYGQR
jgi:MerR family mercuric resistance operon transcriptional regulator